MKKKDLFSSLNDMVFLVQLEEFCDRFNQDMSARTKSDLKKFLKALVPFVIGGVISVVTLNPIFVCLGVAGFGGCAIFKVMQDAKEEEKRILESDERLLRELQRNRAKAEGEKFEEKILYLDEEPDLESQVWGVTPIVSSKASDFYRDEFRELMHEAEADFQKEQERQGPKLELVCEEKPLTKDETQAKIVDEYERYCIIYQIPTMKISPREWDILFDTVYERLEELDVTEEFYPLMNFLLQYVLSTSLLHNKRGITIYSFVEKLPKLEIAGLDKREAQSLARELDTKLNPSSKKVVDLKTLRYKKED